MTISGRYREYARRAVADWPPLTPDQIARLSILLKPSIDALTPQAPQRRRRGRAV